MKINKLIFITAWALLLQGCVLTKVVTVPMRLGGAVISVIPVVGNTIDDSIDTAADVVDEVPI
jgi:starvation-inducible outer membrane lipoprotein